MLTLKKRRYADARELGLGPQDAALKAGYSARGAKQRAYKLDRDSDVLHYREKLKTAPPGEPAEPAPLELPENLSNVDASQLVLRRQLVSRDERIAQGAAKIILDAEHKAKTPAGGKKEQKADAAKGAAGGKFGASAPPKLKAVE